MNQQTRFHPAARLALIMALANGSAWAQQAPDAQQEQSTTPAATHTQAEQAPMPQSADFSDQEVARFAQASAKVLDLQSEYTQQLETHADDQDKVASIQQEAQDKMAEAVQGAGLSIQKYNEIIQVARLDPALAKRIQQAQP